MVLGSSSGYHDGRLIWALANLSPPKSTDECLTGLYRLEMSRF